MLCDCAWAFRGMGTREFSSVAQSCPTLCDPMDCSTPGLPVHHQLPEPLKVMSIESGCHPTISSSVVPFSSHLQSFPASGSFPMSQFFTSGGQSIGASASAVHLRVGSFLGQSELCPCGKVGGERNLPGWNPPCVVTVEVGFRSAREVHSGFGDNPEIRLQEE